MKHVGRTRFEQSEATWFMERGCCCFFFGGGVFVLFCFVLCFMCFPSFWIVFPLMCFRTQQFCHNKYEYFSWWWLLKLLLLLLLLLLWFFNSSSMIQVLPISWQSNQHYRSAYVFVFLFFSNTLFFLFLFCFVLFCFRF